MKTRRAVPLKRLFQISAVLLLMLSAVSCKEAEGGKALAGQGAAAADTLATYYEQLDQDTLDTLELEAFLTSVRGTTFSRESQALYEAEHEALHSRALTAHVLAATYKSFGDLSSYDASAEIDASSQKLGESLKQLVPLPGGVAPGDVIGGLANKIAEWRQGRDIRKANELMIDILSALNTVYGRELEAYKAISEERGKKAAAVSSFLIKDKKIDAKVLLEKIPKSLGLEWSSAGAAPSDDMIAGLATIASVRQQRLAIASVQAGDNLKNTLDLLKTAHERFRTEHRPPLQEVAKALESVKAALGSLVGARTNP